MKKFIFSIILFSIVCYSISITCENFVPYHNEVKIGEDKLLSRKLALLREQPNVNTLFFGSSLIARQLVPKRFDLKTGLNSFNLGIPGMVFFESNYILENFLEIENTSNIKYILFEISPEYRTVRHVLLPSKTKYFYDHTRIFSIANYLIETKNANQLFSLLKEVLSNSKIMNGIPNFIRYFFYQEKSVIGFMNSGLSVESKGYIPLNIKFKEKTSFNLCKNGIEIINTKESTSLTIQKELKRLEEICNNKNIKFIPIYIDECFRCYQSKNNESIVLGDFGLFSAYENKDNWFGPGHLNAQGADLFTDHLSIYFALNFL